MARWAQPNIQRQQVSLFSPTLDAMIANDHPVRLFDDLLSVCDWTPWENHYCLVHGQPPIHPRIVAGVILYGLSRGMRSSRTLEYMLASNIDFMWNSGDTILNYSPPQPTTVPPEADRRPARGGSPTHPRRISDGVRQRRVPGFNL